MQKDHSLRFAPWILPLLACLLGLPAASQPTAPYNVTVWAQALFGPDGKATHFQVVDEATYPAPFVEGVKARLSRARMQPVQDQGAPATFKTGVRMDFLVTPGQGGGTVKLEGLAMEPLPIKRYMASFPGDVALTDGWDGRVDAFCLVGVDGTCKTITVTALPGMPESVRRFARVSLEQWRFEAQQVNGKAIETEVGVRFNLSAPVGAPEDFRQDKFERIQQRR
jgi:hypothetical protein